MSRELICDNNFRCLFYEHKTNFSVTLCATITDPLQSSSCHCRFSDVPAAVAGPPTRCQRQGFTGVSRSFSDFRRFEKVSRELIIIPRCQKVSVGS